MPEPSPGPQRPEVRVDPAQRFGEPHVRGVSVDVLADLVWAGESAATVADEYGVTRPDVLVACWYVARGRRRRGRRRAWAAWLEQVEPMLWRASTCD